MPKRPKRPYATFNPTALIDAARRHGHTTSRAIAQHAGIDETSLSRFASGDRAPGFENLVRLLDAYGLGYRDVVTYKREPLQPPAGDGGNPSVPEPAAA